MRARPGDHIIIKGHHVGDSVKAGEILEVHGDDGQPPFKVRWEDGREVIMFPGSDAVVEHSRPRATSRRNR